GYTQNVENRSAHTPDEWQIMVNEITETEVHENKLSARLKFWKQKFREEEYQKKREYKILAQIIGFILIIFCGLMGTLVPEPYKEEVVILDEMEKEKEMKEVAQLSAMKCNAIRILVQEFHYKHAWINLNSLRRQKLSSDMQKELDQLEALIRYSEEYYKMVGEFLKSVPKPTKMKEGDCELAGYVNEVARFSTPTGEQIALALEKPTVGKYDLYKMVYHHYFAPELETGKRYSTLCYAALEGSREGGNRELARNLLSDIFEKGNEKERQAARLLLDEFWRENIKNDSL
ncbi:MAG: hypothetical protein Q4C70_15650, partial [Planctomycetia bacterium]|nr:hypothetical protein [Planctomycetia bacterium]